MSFLHAVTLKAASLIESLAKEISSTAIRATLPGAKVEIDVPTVLARLIIEAVSRFSWLGVRSFGNLQILTKASYASLVIVPLIAGAWPLIRNLLNQYNNTVNSAAETTQQAANTIESRILALQAVSEGTQTQRAAVLRELESITAKLSEISQNFSYMLHETNMPASFALAFLASLFVAVGHLFFQAFCPQAVKDHDLAGYSNAKINEYLSNRSEVTLAETAEYVAARVNSTSEEILSSVKSNTFRANDILKEISSEPQTEQQSPETDNHTIEKSEYVSVKASPPGGSSQSISGNLLKKKTPDSDQALIDVASRVSYTDKLTEKLGAGVTALLMYAVGVVLILTIVVRQIISVFEASGWLAIV